MKISELSTSEEIYLKFVCFIYVLINFFAIYNIWGMTGAASEVPALWDMDSAAEYYECDCPGPPPEFRLPPPPRPPLELLAELTTGAPSGQGADCHESPSYLDDFETCDMKTVIDAEPSILPTLSSLAIVGLFSLLLLTFILVAAALLCKHKKKMQNLLPCKSSPQNRCDVTHGNGVIYEDLTNVRPRPLPQSSIEMLDVKNYPHSGHTLPHLPNDHHYVTNHFPSMMGAHQPVFICSRPPPIPLYCPQGQNLCNPVYEELSNGSAERGDSDSEDGERLRGVNSEEDFAEDELSGAEQVPSELHAPSSNALSGHHAPSNNSLLGVPTTPSCGQGNFLAPSSGNEVNSDGEEDRARFLNNRAKHSSLPKSRRQGHQGQRQSGARTSGRSHRSTNTSSSHGSNAVGPTSLDRRRPAPSSGDRSWRTAKPEAYHEGLLVDALLQLYPNMVPPPPPSQHRPYGVPCAPYQSVPVISSYARNEPPVSSFRPMFRNFPPPPPLTEQPSKLPSQDSDSGYSNNTSGGTQSTSARAPSRSRTPHRMNADNLYS